MLPDVHISISEYCIVVAIKNVAPAIIRDLVDQLHLKRNLEVVERRFKKVDLEADTYLVPHCILELRRIWIVL